MTKKLYTHKFRTSLGWIRVASTDKGLAVVSFGKKGRAIFESTIKKNYRDYKVISGGAENKRVERQIRDYLAGRLKKFNLKLDLGGTPFQKKALKKIASIPYGRVSTYGEVAAAVGHPRAYRAIGAVNAGNRLPIIIPCHRVVAASGLGGYGGGIEIKERLLRLEGAKFK